MPGTRVLCPAAAAPRVPSDTSRSDLCPPRTRALADGHPNRLFPADPGGRKHSGPACHRAKLAEVDSSLGRCCCSSRASVPWQPLAAAVSGGAPRERTAGHWIRPWANVKLLAAQGQRWTTAVESTVGRGDDMWAPRFDLTGPAPCPVSFLSPPHVFECFA